jgi:hypothetical protein
LETNQIHAVGMDYLIYTAKNLQTGTYTMLGYHRAPSHNRPTVINIRNFLHNHVLVNNERVLMETHDMGGNQTNLPLFAPALRFYDGSHGPKRTFLEVLNFGDLQVTGIANSHYG